MKTRKFNVYTDPGHGWVKVKFTDLIKLDIVDKITPYSYTRATDRGVYCYLEEDIDAGTFIEALRAKGIEPYWVAHHTNKQSKIRSYSKYIPPISLNGSYYHLV